MRWLIVTQIFVALALNCVALTGYGCQKKITVLPDVDYNAPARPVETVEDGVVFAFAEEPQAPASLDFVVIRFEFDSYELTTDYKRLIDLLDVKNCDVELVSGTCPIGTTEYNHALGIRRALVVYDYLLNERGANNVLWRSVGENELVSENPDEYHLNRRCEISVER
jgi:outer membrane protein OmpA-like peptidoglycan-associated protein